MTELRAAAPRRLQLQLPRPVAGWLREHPQAPRAVVALAMVIAAYHYSLLTLLTTLGADTPLAYLGLVPLIALLIALPRWRPQPGEPAIHDRQLDYIVAVPLLAGVLLANLLLPVQLSSAFWTWRLDLLTLPLFVAGVLVLLFGVRTPWRLRLPLLYLLLAWPYPYTVLLVNWLERFTDLTLVALRLLLRVVPVAAPVASGDGSLFQVQHGTTRFALSVASACSGANSLVGFSLVGLAFLTMVRGHRLRLALWLASGLTLVWLINLGRILLIFAIGGRFGERVAIDGFHPYIGIVLFNVGIGLMLLAVRPFGLRLRWQPGPGATADGPVRLRSRPAVRRIGTALVVTCLAVALATVTNDNLRDYDLVANSLGAPQLLDFQHSPGTPDGWAAQRVDSYPWARRFFGEESDWNRYYYTYDGRSKVPYRASLPVVADVITTDSLKPFSTYGVEACYRFHGYDLKDTSRVDLGAGIIGNVVTYYNPKQRSDWTAVYWHWPVRTPGGVRYERVTLLMTDTRTARVAAPDPPADTARTLAVGLQNALRNDGSDRRLTDRLVAARSFMVSFARVVVERRAGSQR